MVTSTTSRTDDTQEASQQYPYPSHVNAASFLSIKLSGKGNYVQWKEQMLCLVDSHDMLGFIDGIVKKPEKYNASIMKANYREWKRSDTLVKGWIFGSLSEDVMGSVVGLETANDVWNELKRNYSVSTTNKATRKQGIRSLFFSKIFGDGYGVHKESWETHLPLYRAIEMGDWEKAKDIFNGDKNSLTEKLNSFGNRALHIAIGNPKSRLFLETLLEQITPELLPSLVNNRQQTAMHYAASLDNLVAAKMLVRKNPDLLFTVCVNNYLPIHKAVYSSHETTFRYLLQMCKDHIELSKKERHHSPFEGEKGVRLLNDTILAGFLDEAYKLLKDYPQLARTKVSNVKLPLWCIAKNRDVYLSAKRYNFYQKIVYSYLPGYEDVPTQKGLHHANMSEDIENQDTSKANSINTCNKSYVYSAMKRLIVKLLKIALVHVPHIKRLQEEKVKHNTALMILKFICKEVCKLESDHFEHCHEAYIMALKNNTPEVIEQITITFPHSVWYQTNDGYILPQVSIMNRCENVYNYFVHEVTHSKYFHITRVDKVKNNLLHLAGQLAPTHKLNMVAGAALQMQRELQWFKEVSKLVRPKEREAMNKNEETPWMVFRKQHKDLRKQGEEWMKKTSESYTIIAALIITIVFAAAITVPGGNKGDTGKPIFETRPSFIIFVFSDAISLFTSTTSLLFFLSILTARYEEEDFLYKLPKRLIRGLVMLFMSVTTMLISFSTALYIMFGEENSWVLILIAAITCLPIASFLKLQLPLLFDLIYLTYGRGIFREQSELRIRQ